MKKRILSILLAMSLLLSVACENRTTKPDPNNPDSMVDSFNDDNLDGGQLSIERGDNVLGSRTANDYSEIFQMITALNEQQSRYFGAVNDNTDGSIMPMEEEGSVAFDSGDSANFSKASAGSDVPMGGGGEALNTEAQMRSDERAVGGGDVPNFSDTNNQVEGVQESDIVKTDGKHIFVTSQPRWNYNDQTQAKGRVSVIKPDNGNMELVTQITLENAEPSEMLLYNGRLIIIWNQYEYIESASRYFENNAGIVSADFDYGWWGGWSRCETIVQIYNTNGDFSKPDMTYTQNGSFNSVRMIDNHIYLLTAYRPLMPRNFTEDDLFCYIPSYSVNGNVRFVPATSIAIPEKLDWVNYTVIGAIDVNSQDLSPSVVSDLGYTGVVYATTDNFYLTSYDWVESGTVASRRFGSSGESYTKINRFAIDAGTVSFKASGRVRGGVENQFYFDEYNGILRVVTQVWGASKAVLNGTANEPSYPEEPQYPDFGDNWELYDKWWKDVYYPWEEQNREAINAYNAWYWENFGSQGASLYTLDMDLNILATIDEIAVGENVQSVRFMGDIGYVVTFLNVDPLFSFDLSDPHNPKQLDELKIPGFSRYMHPWADGLLLGLGVDADEDESSPTFGWRTGLKLSMFDTSDNENLSERHVYIIKNPTERSHSSTPIEWTHKAALVSPERNIIGFPYSYYDWSGNSEDAKAAYALFRYDDNGFTLIGEIEIKGDYGYHGYYVPDDFQRGLFIGDYLYAIANNIIVSALIGDNNLVKIAELKL